jgi:S-adenosylmethionine-diacylgycerolhomoserine-N-methlytransferase
MSLARDLKTLFHLTLAPIRGQTHEERLESFYGAQAADYDRFRERLLHGRRELYKRLPTPAGAVWVELGGGTGANLEILGERRRDLKQIHIVDLSASLLEVARARVETNRWDNVALHLADATTVRLPEKADVVTFSYSLTMIPDWYLALENARRLLKPDGWIGVVDFYVARKHPAEGQRRHGWATRTFWPAWFASDNVFPSPDHVPYLHQHFAPVHFAEQVARIRFFPLLRTPYYEFVGRNRSQSASG